MKMVFQISATRRLIFTDEAILQMQSKAQHCWWKPEAGGALLGRHLLDSEDIVVDEVTTPQRQDKRSRFSFFRSKQHGVIARSKWYAQDHTMAYLGLWHTHPEKDPTPSSVDRSDWANAVAEDVFEGDRLFFPIVGTEAIHVWSKTREGPIEKLLEVKK